MMNAGLFAGQRFELIDGDLIEKMPQLPPHANGIRCLSKLLSAVFGEDRVQAQLPIEVAPGEQKYTVPEPDLAVMAESAIDLENRHPRGNELALVIEVADTSLRYDANGQRDLFARAGVPEYWVWDLKGRKLIVHRNPKRGKYTSQATLTSRDTVTIEGHAIRVAGMLP